MANADIDVLEILAKIPQLADAQVWEIARRCRLYRARSDGEDQVVDVEVSVDIAGRWMVVAHDAVRELTAQGVPMPGRQVQVSRISVSAAGADPVAARPGPAPPWPAGTTPRGRGRLSGDRAAAQATLVTSSFVVRY